MKQTTAKNYLSPLCGEIGLRTGSICATSDWDVSGVSVENLDNSNETDMGNNW